MLRQEKEAGTKLGIETGELTRRGQLVPDETVNALVAHWLGKHDSEFIFDGYPRSIGQAEGLDRLLVERETPLEVVLSFEADFTTLQSRVLHRAVCSRCRRNFSIGLHIATLDEPCPICGGALVRRGDDTLETLDLRMREYAEKTEPLIAYYSKRGLLYPVDATRTPDAVFASVAEILEAA